MPGGDVDFFFIIRFFFLHLFIFFYYYEKCARIEEYPKGKIKKLEQKFSNRHCKKYYEKFIKKILSYWEIFIYDYL